MSAATRLFGDIFAFSLVFNGFETLKSLVLKLQKRNQYIYKA